jgi:MFS family permease
MSNDLLLVALSLVTWGVGEGMFLYFEPLYLQELGANPVLIGGILGSVGLAMAVSYLPAGYLSDRFGRRPMLRIAWLIGMSATVIMALAQNIPVFVAGMAVYGFTSFVIVPLNSYVTHARGKWSVGRTMTLVSACFNFGFILGPLIGGWVGERYGLQRTFQIAAFIFIISTLIIFRIRPQPVEKPTSLENTAAWKSLINIRFLKYILLIFFVAFTLYLPQPLSQIFLQNQRNLTLTQIGQLVSVRSLGIVVLSLILGQFNARVGFLLAQIGVAAFTLFMLRGQAMPWYFAGYFLLGSYQTARVLAIAQGRTLIQSAAMGIGYGMLETAMTIAIVLAPPLAGLLYQLNPLYIYSVSLILIIIAFLLSIFFSPIKRSDI